MRNWKDKHYVSPEKRAAFDEELGSDHPVEIEFKREVHIGRSIDWFGKAPLPHVKRVPQNQEPSK